MLNLIIVLTAIFVFYLLTRDLIKAEATKTRRQLKFLSDEFRKFMRQSGNLKE